MNEATASQPLLLVGMALFTVAWFVGFSSWFLGAAEIAAIYLLRDLLFERGPVALRRQVELSPPSPPRLDEKTTLERSHVRFTSPTRAIFGSRYRWWALGRGKSAVPVKGVVRWVGSQAEVVVRHPLGLVLFMLAWLTGWTIGSLMVALAALYAPDQEELSWALPMAVLGGVAGYGMYRVLLWQGRRSAGVVADEVLAHLGA